MTRFLAWIAPRPGRHLLERPAGATYSDFHAPAASLGTACASPRQGAGRKRIAAGAMPLVRPAISLLPRPCPVTHPGSIALLCKVSTSTLCKMASSRCPHPCVRQHGRQLLPRFRSICWGRYEIVINVSALQLGIVMCPGGRRASICSSSGRNVVCVRDAPLFGFRINEVCAEVSEKALFRAEGRLKNFSVLSAYKIRKFRLHKI